MTRASGKGGRKVTSAIIGRSRVKPIEQRDRIPYFEPGPLPDGLHIAPWRSWDGSPLLVVVKDGQMPFPPLHIDALRSPMREDPFPYSDKWLAGYLKPWARGVYRDPNPPTGFKVDRFLAVDSHGRIIHVAVEVGATHGTKEMIDMCRRVLVDEDPLLRPRPRGQTRF